MLHSRITDWFEFIVVTQNERSKVARVMVARILQNGCQMHKVSCFTSQLTAFTDTSRKGSNEHFNNSPGLLVATVEAALS